MILRKPYAFLIKHFKLIHLILTTIYIYLAFYVNNILKYYNNFISGSTGKLDAIKYINSYYLIAIISSIIICIIILILMHHKKKPKLLYIILIILYLIIALIISTTLGGLNTIYFSILEVKTLRLYRDLLRIILIIQYLTIAMSLIRGLGFDIKKFNFVKDLNEMNIEVSDDEEVELTLNGTNTITRKIRRKLRELKYYYVENKVFIIIIIIILIIIGVSTITIDKQVINKVYSEGEVFSTDTFNFQVLSTHITNKSYNNQMLTNNDSSFLIVKLQITPKEKGNTINTSNLILQIDNKTYKLNNRYYEKFKDIGYGYKNQKINTTKNYLFVYNVPNEELDKKILLIYGDDKKISLNPQNLDEVNSVTKLKLQETIDLKNTVLSFGTIIINSYEINNKFSYEYNYYINENSYISTLNITSVSNTILKLNLTSSLPNSLTPYEIISENGKIKYTIQEEEYTSKILNSKTPGNAKDELYLEVDKDIEKADNIYLELIIRDKEYIYAIK